MSRLNFIIKIILIYIKTSFTFKGYSKSEVENSNEEIDLIYICTSHYNLLYKINSKFKSEMKKKKKINNNKIFENKIIKNPSIKNINELNNENKI